MVNLGDTFDTHAVLRSEIMGEAIDHVDFVLALGIPYVYVLGNHDMYKPKHAKYHALKHLKGKIKNLYIVDQVTDLFNITFVPYQPDIATFPTNTKEICVAHQSFKGADYGSITDKNGVDASRIQGASIIYSGHIHKRQRVIVDSAGSTEKQIVYVGSPFSQSASDIDQVKGISVVDTASLLETFYECPLPKWRSDKFVIEQGFTTDDMHKYISKLVGSKDHWYIDITGPRAEIVRYLASSEYKKTVEGVDVKIKTSYTDREKRQVKIKSLSADNIVSQYVAKVYSGSLDKKLLTEKAIEVLKSTE